MAVDGKPKNRKLLIALIIGLPMLFAFVVAFVPAYLRSSNERAKLATPEGIERMALSEPRAAALFATMRQTHPDEFEAFKRQTAAQVAQGASSDAIAKSAETFIEAAMTRHRPALLQAPPAELDAYREMEASIIAQLQAASPATCGGYAMTGKLAAADVPKGMENLVDAQKITWWRAAAAGRDRPAGRTIGPLSAADGEALAQAMRADGISDADLQTFYDQAAMNRAEPARQCAIINHLLRGIRRLPDGTRANATALAFSRTA